MPETLRLCMQKIGGTAIHQNRKLLKEIQTLKLAETRIAQNKEEIKDITEPNYNKIDSNKQ